MKNKKWWKILLPVIIVIKVLVIVLVLGSARSDDTKIVVESETKFTSVKIPDKFAFAGEDMPLDRFDVKEALDRELLSNAYFHSQTIRYIKLAPRYFPVIEPILKEKKRLFPFANYSIYKIGSPLFSGNRTYFKGKRNSRRL